MSRRASALGWMLCIAPVFAQDGSPAGSRDLEPVPPTQHELATVAAELDAAFVAGDADRYLQRFVPLHAALHRAMTQRIRAVLGTGIRLERHSRIERYWQLGRNAVVLVASETRNPTEPERGGVREHSLWAARDAGDALRIVFAIEMDAGTLAVLPESGDPLVPKRSIRCVACNYSIQSANDWLMVPNCGGRTGCLESFSFYSLGDDLAVDLSVHLSHDATVPTPAAMLRGLVQGVVGTAATDVDVDVEPWLPPMYTATNRPMYLDGARCVVVPPETGGVRAEIRLATYGRVGYLFVIRGLPAVVESNRPTLDALLRTFTVDDPTLEPDKVVARITEDRQGGTLDDCSYVNQRFGVRFAPPTGWTGRMEAGQYAFDVSWRHPDDLASIRVKAMPPPPGAERWTTIAVDRMFANTCERAGLRTERDGGWHACTAGFTQTRLFDAVPTRAESGAPLRTLLRASIDDDLLVVVEAQVRDASLIDVARHALLGLHRER